MAPHSNTLAWKISWTGEPGRLQSMGSLRVRHDWATSLSLSCIGEGNGNPLQCSCLENPRDSGAWWLPSMGSHRVGHDWSDIAAAAKIDSAGKESTCNAWDLGSNPGLGRWPGEGKGLPLQYSGLENSMDYIVHGIANSQTRLNNFHQRLVTQQYECTSTLVKCTLKMVKIFMLCVFNHNKNRFHL